MLALVLAAVLSQLTPPLQPPDAPQSEVAAVFVGQKVPFMGILVTEDRFKLYLGLQVKNEELRLRLELRDRLLLEAEKKVNEAQAQAVRSWWEQNSFWVGFGLGIIMAALLVYGAAEVVKAAK